MKPCAIEMLSGWLKVFLTFAIF